MSIFAYLQKYQESFQILQAGRALRILRLAKSPSLVLFAILANFWHFLKIYVYFCLVIRIPRKLPNFESRACFAIFGSSKLLSLVLFAVLANFWHFLTIYVYFCLLTGSNGKLPNFASRACFANIKISKIAQFGPITEIISVGSIC